MSSKRSLLLLQAALGIALVVAPAHPARAAQTGYYWKAIASTGFTGYGGDSTCALQNTGYVYCWGSNLYGQLGNPSVASGGNSNVAVTVQGLPAPATAIAMGGDGVACAVLTTGAVYCWGDNSYGQIGNASAPPFINKVPFAVQGLPASATSIAIGQYHACASLSTGAVACWGLNAEAYVLGNASIAAGTRVLPTLVPGVARAVSVSAGWNSTCALVHPAFVLKGHPMPYGPQCWGANEAGQGGQPQQSPDILPTNDNNVPWDITSLSAGGSVTCATSQSQGSLCWGADSPYNDGALGDNFACAATPASEANCYLPQPVQFSASPGTSPTYISSGPGTACAVYGNGIWGVGSLYCWGANGDGQAGLPSTSEVGRATGIPVWGQAEEVTSAESHTCAIVNGGSRIQCWGANNSGQLGNGTYTSSYLPVTMY